MRYVPKDCQKAPACLEKKGGNGKTETERAIEYYSRWEKAKKEKKAFAFKAYKRPEVKRALKKMFNNKCAYCEAELPTQTPDIEHWRPKGGVYNEKKKKLITPGYYWLAANWDNLLPSCSDCNRSRYHEYEKENKKIKHGKENLFPLGKGSKRARNPKDKISLEKPLLLNPCTDHPEEYIDISEEEGYIFCARTDIIPDKMEKAQRSIEVYGLNRPDLAQSRRMLLKTIETDIQHIVQLAQDIDLTRDPVEMAKKRRWVMERMAALEQYTEPDHAYTFMVKKRIERFRFEGS